MNPAYTDVELETGSHDGGLYKIEIAPIEWLAAKIEIEFSTGTVFTPALIDGKEWLELQLTPDTYSYEEIPKESKSGKYYETTIGGLCNNLSSELLQVMETLRHHQFVVIAHDLKKARRICGNIDAGMFLSIADDNKNDGGGKLSVGYSFTMQHQRLNPTMLDICEGVTNFDDYSVAIPDVIPPTAMYGVFTNGSSNARTEVQVIELPSGDTTDIVLDAGDNELGGDEAFWEVMVQTETFKVRWRRRCIGGYFTDWEEKTLTNPFY